MDGVARLRLPSESDTNTRNFDILEVFSPQLGLW
ncbi:MAG: hypothetical protein ACI955_000019 [Zhongshania sp.]|jgi:hypothetical protein